MFYVKQNDTSPALRATLKDHDGNGVNLTGATVVFHMKPARGSTAKVSNGVCSLVDDANGLVEYLWNSGDTDTTGTFYGEFQVTYADSTIETFPNKDYIRIKIVSEVA